MKKHIKALKLFGSMTTLCMIILLSCQSGQKPASNKAEGESFSLEHKLGKVTVPIQPKRVVVLDIGALETMNELGLKPIAVPKQNLPAYLSSIKDDQQIANAGSVIEPNLEAISAQQPDLILISSRQERFYPELSEIAPTVFIGTDNKHYLPSFVKNVELIGRIFNKEERAKTKLDSLMIQVEKAQKHFENDPNKGLFLIYNNGKFSAFGKGSRFGFIHDVIGIKPVMELQDESVHGQRISNELIAEANPDYLFIVDRNSAVMGRKANKEEVENPLVKKTKAYQNHKLYYLDPEVWFISGGGLTSVQMMVQDIVQLIQ